MKFDQATGLCGGSLVPSDTIVPVSASAAKLGSFPSAMKRRSRSGSSPSTPMISSGRASRLPCAREQPVAKAASAPAKATVIATASARAAYVRESRIYAPASEWPSM